MSYRTRLFVFFVFFSSLPYAFSFFFSSSIFPYNFFYRFVKTTTSCIRRINSLRAKKLQRCYWFAIFASYQIANWRVFYNFSKCQCVYEVLQNNVHLSSVNPFDYYVTPFEWNFSVFWKFYFSVWFFFSQIWWIMIEWMRREYVIYEFIGIRYGSDVNNVAAGTSIKQRKSVFVDDIRVSKSVNERKKTKLFFLSL